MNRPDYSNDEAFDALIRASLTDDSAAGETLSVARLERFWHVRFRRRTRRRRGWQAAAAALLVVCGAGVWRWSQQQEASRPDAPNAIAAAGEDASDVSSMETEAAGIDLAANPIEQRESSFASERPAATVGREPTELERLMFLAQTRTPMRQVEATLSQTVDAVVERMIAAPGASRLRNAFLASCPRDEVDAELRRRLPLGTLAEQRALLALLSSYGTDASLDAMLAASSQPELQREALAAIERVAGISRWPELAERTDSDAVRRAISRRLIAALDDGDAATRLAAAEAIGRSFDCEVTGELIDRVARQPSGTDETWLALFACRCPQADAFLTSASQDPHFLGQFNNAWLRWERLIQ